MITATRPAELVTHWRALATEVEACAPNLAALWMKCAAELEATLDAELAATVGLQEAAVLSGHAPDSLGKMIKHGRLVNYGSKHRPRVRVGELPRKAVKKTDPAEVTVEACEVGRPTLELLASAAQRRKR